MTAKTPMVCGVLAAPSPGTGPATVAGDRPRNFWGQGLSIMVTNPVWQGLSPELLSEISL